MSREPKDGIAAQDELRAEETGEAIEPRPWDVAYAERRAQLDGFVAQARQGERVLFADYALHWLDRQRDLTSAGLLRASTLSRFESALGAHFLPFFGGFGLAEIDTLRLEQFRTTLFVVGNLKPRTINGLIAVLRLILRRARLDGVSTAPDPTTSLYLLPVAVRRIDCYSRAEVGALLAAMPDRWAAVVGFAALAGLRQGEIYALRRSDVDLSQRVIHISHSLSARTDC
jgi:integrase